MASQKQQGNSGEEGARETISFAYGAVIQQYSRTSASGVIAAPTVASWSVITNSLFKDPLPGICRATV